MQVYLLLSPDTAFRSDALNHFGNITGTDWYNIYTNFIRIIYRLPHDANTSLNRYINKFGFRANHSRAPRAPQEDFSEALTIEDELDLLFAAATLEPTTASDDEPAPATPSPPAVTADLISIRPSPPVSTAPRLSAPRPRRRQPETVAAVSLMEVQGEGGNEMVEEEERGIAGTSGQSGQVPVTPSGTEAGVGIGRRRGRGRGQGGVGRTAEQGDENMGGTVARRRAVRSR